MSLLDRIPAAALIKWAVGAALVLVLATGLVVHSCSGARQKSEQSKQDSRSAAALADTAQEAVRTIIAQAEEEASVDDLVVAAKEEIRNAPSDEAAGAAARAAICRLPEYRADPACRLQRVHP